MGLSTLPVSFSELDMPHSAALYVCSMHHYESINTNSVLFINVYRRSSAKAPLADHSTKHYRTTDISWKKGNNIGLLK
jgi:hypothetical protein